MNISSIKWEGSRHAIFRFVYLQLQPFRGSLTLFYSDFKVVGEICRDLFRFLQCSHDPGCSYPQPLIIWSKMPRVGAQPLKGMADAGSITNFMVGWKVEASHFIVAALGNHTSSHTLFQNGPFKRRGWHQGMQKDGRCWLNHQLHGGLKGWGQPFYSGSTWKSYL